MISCPKDPRRKRIKPGRVENPAHLKWVRSLPCIACEMDDADQTSPTEAHHIRRRSDGTCYGKGQKAHDTETIPLCSHTHHWNGVHCASKLSHRAFEAKYGNERDLLARTMWRMNGVAR